MTKPDAAEQSHRERLRAIAINAMRARGLDPTFPPDALAQAAGLGAAPTSTEEPVRDLRPMLWCSIDNDDSRDLDQLSVMESAGGDGTRVLVAIADVDAVVTRASPIDQHAALNTTSVYTPAAMFPMLPERLSTDLTSLSDQQDRLAIVIEYTVAGDGSIAASDVYGALVRNRAKLAYNAVAAWLTGSGPVPPAVAAVNGMDAQVRLQDNVAQTLGEVRHEHGALAFETIELQAHFEDGTLSELRPDLPNRAKALIENLMIAANGVCARFLELRGLPSIRRVVRTPDRWDRLAALAAQSGDHLPPAPDPKALAGFLQRRKAADPVRFPDLSHAVIQLLGRGEYVVEHPGGTAPGHFGLAVKDYTHSTAPNRRFPDLLTQRLLKAALAGHEPPYGLAELDRLAAHCTAQEDAANKVERQVRKSAAALLMSSQVGTRYDAVVTGASPKGTFVRSLQPPVEGMLVRGAHGVDVGDRIRVQLISADVERGFIDFARA